MKKSLFALAALGAFASAAQAQSTVTLYGTFDTSIYYLADTRAANSASQASVTSTQVLGTGTHYIDSAFATSSWGMRGSEDLGRGMKANFHLESDILTNSGNTHSAGLFRRAANVSLADAKLGEVFLGRRGNAYIIATGQMLPVQGNTAHQWRNVIRSSVGDQISNSVSYATPTVMATNVLVQYGLNNTIDNGDDGTMFAAHLVNKSIKGLQITAAYNNAKASTGVATSTSLSTVSQASAANAAITNTEGYAVGLKYQVTPAIAVGTFYAHGRQNNGTNNGTTTAANLVSQSSGAGGFGLGYQAAPNLLLGANFVKTTFQAQMTNLQAHYMLSKRTRIYSQITMTQAPKGNIQSGNLAAHSFSPVGCNSSSNTTTTTAGVTTAATCAGALPTTAGTGNVPQDAKGYGIGVIHTF